MKATVQINRSQLDAMPVVVLPVDRVGPAVLDLIPIGNVVHVLTDAELRARDERMIQAGRISAVIGDVVDIDAIIAAAEAES